MSRLTAAFAVLATTSVLAIGLVGCTDSSPAAQPGPAQGGQTAPDPAADSDQTPPDDISTPSVPSSGAGGSEVCDDEQYVTKVVADLQQKNSPGDIQAVADRLNKFLAAAPAEIQRAAQGVSGPILLAMKHSEYAGMVTTDAVKKDVAELDAWHTKNC